MNDIRQSINYKTYLQDLNWKVLRIKNTNYFIKRLPLIGSIVKLQRPQKLALKILSKIAKDAKAFKIIVEPKDEKESARLVNAGYKQARSTYLPSKTILLDLTSSKEKVFAGFKKDARYALRKTQKTKVYEIGAREIEKFRNAWRASVGPKRYVPPTSHLAALKKSFGNDCAFLYCKNTKGKIISGAVFLISEKHAYYWQAFTDKEGRKFLSQYKIIWKAILWAKERGAKVFDFEGIYDERFPNKTWRGFTHFKKSFGGKTAFYPGTFVKKRLPV